MAVWQAVELVAKQPETPTAATLRFGPEGWPGHRAGQHVDVRLTADDGYQAQRSYSIASAPEDGALALTVERLDDGEVSPYLVDDMAPGDVLELRGPIGGWFVWDVADGGPLLLVGGGSAVVPLREPSGVHVRARLPSHVQPSEVQSQLEHAITVETRARPHIALEEVDGDELVMAITARPRDDSEGPRLADQVLAALVRLERESGPARAPRSAELLAAR